MEHCDLVRERELNDGRYSYRCTRCKTALISYEHDAASIPARACIASAEVADAPPCICNGPGWCIRHQMGKTQFHYEICQNDETQRRTWDHVARTGSSPYGERPSAARMAFNFSVAWVKHVAGGSVTRTNREISTILETCQACPSGRFNGSFCEHVNCGCHLNRHKFASKIAWASEHCPDGHW